MNHLTLGERQKLAELRRRMQKAPNRSEKFAEQAGEATSSVRIERGIEFTLAVFTLVFLGYLLQEVRFAGLPEEILNFLGWLWRVPLW